MRERERERERETILFILTIMCSLALQLYRVVSCLRQDEGMGKERDKREQGGERQVRCAGTGVFPSTGKGHK